MPRLLAIVQVVVVVVNGGAVDLSRSRGRSEAARCARGVIGSLRQVAECTEKAAHATIPSNSERLACTPEFEFSASPEVTAT